MKTRLFLGGAGILLLLFLIPQAEVSTPVEKFHIAMGTVVRIALYDDGIDKHDDEKEILFTVATNEIDRIDSTMSAYRSNSELNQLNREASKQPHHTSPELQHLLKLCLVWSQKTGGAYDATVGPLTELWNFPEALSPPDSARVDSAKALVGHKKLRIEPSGVTFSMRGMRVDLGGSAKGYAIDRAVELLQNAGVEAGLVEAGGDIRFWGHKPNGNGWQFGVQHPRERERFLVVEDVGLPALATSGDYEQVFEFEGRRFHHLLDPATGYPANKAISASVWAENALAADILATAAFVLGPDAGCELIEGINSTETVIFYNEGGLVHYRASSGLNGHFTERFGLEQ